MEVHGILGNQSFEQRPDDIVLGDAGGDLRIEIFRLGTVGEVQDLIAIPLFNPRHALAAAGNPNNHGQAACEAEQGFGGQSHDESVGLADADGFEKRFKRPWTSEEFLD